MQVKFENRNLSLEEFEKSQISFYNYGLEFSDHPHQQEVITIVATLNGSFVGFIKGLVQKYGTSFGKYCYLSDLLIEKEYRKKGYAKNLLKLFEKKTKNLGINYIWLWTPSYESSSLYLKCGYKIFTKFTNFYESGFERVGLMKEL